MKHSFIHTGLCVMFLICGGCTQDTEMDDREETVSGRIPLTIQATASGFDNLPASDHPSTRIPLESGFETFFNTGDAIGIFAVKNTAIADGVNNIKLTYLKTGLTTGDWTPPKGTSLYWSEGMEYIAYYPYKEGVTIDATQTPDEIVASLADKLRPVSDQSTPAKHTACDLMTALGAITTNDSKGTLKLNFRHQFALLILKPQAKFKYIPLESDPVYTYRSTLPEWIVDVTAKDVEINKCNPCKMDDGSYRAIVLPQESSRITGSYKTTDINNGMDKTLNYSGSKFLSFVAGKCYTLEVQSPMASSEKKRALAPGDFVFFNNGKIEIYPGDGDFEGTTIPEYEKAVGMVITCDPDRMTDKLCNDKGWNHAYVMGLFDTFEQGRWGVEDVDEPIGEITKDDPAKIKANMNGYSETEKILELHPNDNNYSAFNIIQQYRKDNPFPTDIACSPWFMPSIGQWWDVLTNISGESPIDFKDNITEGLESHSLGTETKEKLNKQLAKVGKSLGNLINYRHIFWSSTEYDKGKGWIIIWHFEMMNNRFWDRVGIKGFTKSVSSGYKIIPFFAF